MLSRLHIRTFIMLTRDLFHSSLHYPSVTLLLLPLLDDRTCSSAEYARIKINAEKLKTLLVSSDEVHIYVLSTRCNTA
jgi:hypothetical protein